MRLPPASPDDSRRRFREKAVGCAGGPPGRAFHAGKQRRSVVAAPHLGRWCRIPLTARAEGGAISRVRQYEACDGIRPGNSVAQGCDLKRANAFACEGASRARD
jgi:hypothetical protein